MESCCYIFQPTATPLAQSRSVFAKMVSQGRAFSRWNLYSADLYWMQMGRKRRMEQLDGSVDPGSDHDQQQPADTQEVDTRS